MQPDRSDVVTIARCPEHGLHGERTECFVCGGPVEQVRMVPAEFVEGAVVAGVEVAAKVRDANQAERRRLEAEVERLTRERDHAVEARENANAATLRAEAEVERLRDGLVALLAEKPKRERDDEGIGYTVAVPWRDRLYALLDPNGGEQR